MTVDASLYGLFRFPRSPSQRSARRVDDAAPSGERLLVKTEIGGVARYENDYYHQVSKDVSKVAGNPWFICTLWLAQYEIARAKSGADLAANALPLLIGWPPTRSSGVLAEQVDPFTGAPISVSPLTWSHAELVSAVVE
mgnify:CR=1 FL=1